MNTLIALSGIGIIAMLSEIFRFKKVLQLLVLIGLLCALGLTIADWNTSARYYNDMMFFDNYAVAFSGLMVSVTILWFVLSGNFLKNNSHEADYTALILFSLAGAVVMVSYSDLTMFFIGLEVLSVSMYVMSASNKNELRSNEAGFKYFMLGAFATGFMLFGIALIYGASGSFNLQAIANYVSTNKDSLPVIFYAGILLTLVGLTFKISAAPFHFWAPDVYEGAPTPVTAYMSTVVKTAAFGAFLRLFTVCFTDIHDWWAPVIAVFSALSMLAGNILAVYQKSMKRMLAYSSISHAGYMLMAIVALNDLSSSALLLYTAAYSLASIGIFTLVISMTNINNELLSSLKGFSKVHPFAAFGITIITLSLAGIPPIAGFFGKYYMFYSAIKSDYLWLVLIAVISSLIGVYYYFRIIISMYQHSDRDAAMVRMNQAQVAVLFITVILSILIGIMPGFLVGLLK